ncbi:MAG: DUF72 domain-containing protein [Mariniblastus sp.]
MSFQNELYLLGCPVWSCPQWKGSVYSPKAPKDRWLSHYSSVFNTVEGNSTFYGIPHPKTFQKWADRTEPGFKFCLKFPRAVSHEKELLNADAETDQFLKGLEILHAADRLGPTFLQLGPHFGPTQFNSLAAYLEQLPTEFPYAVEVRHPDWFGEPAESALDQVLRGLGIDRVIFDSRPLYSALPTDPIEAAAQQRKPKIPIRKTITGISPMLRLIGRNDLTTVKPWVEEWAEEVANWIDVGLKPIVFAHVPDDQFAPEFAMMFHNELAKLVDEIKPLEEWKYAAPTQRELF